MTIKFFSRVKKVENKQRTVSARKTGRKTEDGKDEIETQTKNLGWFMLLEDSWESFYVGTTEPDFKIGDAVEVTIRKVQQ